MPPSHPTLIYVTRLLHASGYFSLAAYAAALLIVRPLLTKRSMLLSQYYQYILQRLKRITTRASDQLKIVPVLRVKYGKNDLEYSDASIGPMEPEFRVIKNHEKNNIVQQAEKLEEKLRVLNSQYDKKNVTQNLSEARGAISQLVLRTVDIDVDSKNRSKDISNSIRALKSKVL